MIEYIIAIAVFLSLYLYYQFVYKPKKLLNFYVDSLNSLGYKVRVLPFKAFQAPFFTKFIQGFQKYGDSYYFDKKQTESYDVSILNVMNVIVIDMVNPDLMKQLLSMQKIYIYPKKQQFVSNFKRLLGNGVAFSEGMQWKHKRKIITAVFNYDFIKSIIPEICKSCDQQFEKFQILQKKNSQKQLKNQVLTTEVYILDVAFRIFANILMTSFFGIQSKNYQIQGETPCQFLTKLLNHANEQSFSLPGFIFGTWVYKVGLTKRDRQINRKTKLFRQTAQSIVRNKIQKLKMQGAKQEYKDLIEALVFNSNITNQSKSGQNTYSVKDVVDEFCTLFAAATDTSSHFYMMMIYYIVSSPDVQKTLREQIQQNIKSDEDINAQNLKKIKYIDWIQEETTRLYGPGTGIFLRQAIKDNQILNIPIKKGTCLSIKPTLNHYNKNIFEDPLQFKPERWGDEKLVKKLHPYTIMGFSGGPRSCIGKHLAMLQTKIAIVKLFKRYQKIQLEKPFKQLRFNFKFLYQPDKIMTKLSKSK